MANASAAEKKSDLSPATVKAIKDNAKPTESKSDKFVRLANRRVNRLIKHAKFVRNLADTRNYSYTPAQADRVTKACQKVLDEVIAAFAGQSVSGDGWSL